MPTAEYRCKSCKTEYEYNFTLEQWPFVDSFQCLACGGEATRYFSYAPAISPDPMWNGYYDTQLGKYITSRDEKKRLLKEKGLEEVSPDEHRKGFESFKEKEDVIPADDPKLRAAMEKAYADTVSGNIPPVTPRKVDIDGDAVIS